MKQNRKHQSASENIRYRQGMFHENCFGYIQKCVCAVGHDIERTLFLMEVPRLFVCLVFKFEIHFYISVVFFKSFSKEVEEHFPKEICC